MNIPSMMKIPEKTHVSVEHSMTPREVEKSLKRIRHTIKVVRSEAVSNEETYDGARGGPLSFIYNIPFRQLGNRARMDYVRDKVVELGLTGVIHELYNIMILHLSQKDMRHLAEIVTNSVIAFRNSSLVVTPVSESHCEEVLVDNAEVEHVLSELLKEPWYLIIIVILLR